VELIEDLGELLGLRRQLRGWVVMAGLLGDRDFLLVYPHGDRLLEQGGVGGDVLSNELRHGGTPVAGAHDGHLVPLLSC